MQAKDGRPGVPRHQGSDADDDDNDGADVDGGFIDLADVRDTDYPPPPGYPSYPSQGNGTAPAERRHLPPPSRGSQITVRQRLYGNTIVHPNGTVMQTAHNSMPPLHLNGAPTSNGSPPSLPFPLTARTSPNPTPEPNGPTQTAETNASAGTSGSRRLSPGFLSFASAIARGTWMGGSASRSPERVEPSSPSAVNGIHSAAPNGTGSSSSRQSTTATGPSSPPVMRQWTTNAAAYGNGAGSQLPSPSNSAAAFAMAGSTPQGVSPPNSRHPSSREASVESLLTIRNPNSSRQDLQDLEDSLQSALAGTPSASRGRERQRGINGVISGYGEAPNGSSSRSGSSRHGAANGTSFSPADGWQGRSRT